MEVSSKIKSYSIYNIDNNSAQCKKIDISKENNKNLLPFLITVAANTRSSSSSRKCNFKPDSFIKPLIEDIIKGNDIETQCFAIASYLAVTEFSKKTDNSGFASNIKKGSLIITRVQIANEEILIITKIDIEDFFDSKTMALNHGLPVEKGLLKSCLITLENNSFNEPFSLADSNGAISSFWVNNFIGANYIRDNQENTNLAIRSILSVISPINRVSKEDHVELRQNLFSYMNTTKNYVHDDMIEAVIGDYKPVSEKVNTTIIKTKLTALSTNNKFDGNFEIDKTIVKAKGQNNFKLDHDIVLKVNDADVGHVYHKFIDGKPYVLIKTDIGYERFKLLKSTN